MAKKMYTGMCIGGPMQGKVGESRCPKGFVLVNKPKGVVTVYDRDEATGDFLSRDEEPYDEARAFHAAEGSNYDVRALDAP